MEEKLSTDIIPSKYASSSHARNYYGLSLSHKWLLMIEKRVRGKRWFFNGRTTLHRFEESGNCSRNRFVQVLAFCRDHDIRESAPATEAAKLCRLSINYHPENTAATQRLQCFENYVTLGDNFKQVSRQIPLLTFSVITRHCIRMSRWQPLPRKWCSWTSLTLLVQVVSMEVWQGFVGSQL
jgi:hypothetical protein